MFSAYDAKSGKKLWSIDLKTGILAPAMTYEIDGEQYVALLAGWGGAGGLCGVQRSEHGALEIPDQPGPPLRLQARRHAGGRRRSRRKARRRASRRRRPADAATGREGLRRSFTATARSVMASSRSRKAKCPTCGWCRTEIWSQYDAIVLDGALADDGMASFKDMLSKDDVGGDQGLHPRSSRMPPGTRRIRRRRPSLLAARCGKKPRILESLGRRAGTPPEAAGEC